MLLFLTLSFNSWVLINHYVLSERDLNLNAMPQMSTEDTANTKMMTFMFYDEFYVPIQ